MGSRRAGAVAALLVLVVAPTMTGAAAPAPALAEGSQVDPDSVLLRIDLRSDGSAMWAVEYRVRLDDENTTEAFESLRTDIEANRSTFEERFASRMRPTVNDAENATGRAMALRNVSVDATNTTIPQRYGVIVYTFVWDGFAAVEGDRLRAGDAIAGLFLDAETTLLISWPAGYQLADVSPDPDEQRERAAVWSGRLDFADGEPRVVVAPGPGTATTSDGTGGTTPDGTTPGPADGNGDGGDGTPATLLIAVAVVVLAAVGAVGWLYTRRSGRSGSPIDGGGDGEGGDGNGDDDQPPEELLSNEERVLRLLEEHGGRMKQQQVASELDWTDAKTSQVVGELRDAEEIDVFRLGRENVLSLPDDDSI